MSDKILKFEASWCGPCQSLSKSLEGVDLGLEVEKIDIDADTPRAVKFNIRSVPTMVYMRNDKEVSRIVGAQAVSDIQKWVATFN
jgi:thioredoxin 2